MVDQKSGTIKTSSAVYNAFKYKDAGGRGLQTYDLGQLYVVTAIEVNLTGLIGNFKFLWQHY